MRLRGDQVVGSPSLARINRSLRASPPKGYVNASLVSFALENVATAHKSGLAASFVHEVVLTE